jgi:hypothetical protein
MKMFENESPILISRKWSAFSIQDQGRLAEPLQYDPVKPGRNDEVKHLLFSFLISSGVAIVQCAPQPQFRISGSDHPKSLYHNGKSLMFDV